MGEATTCTSCGKPMPRDAQELRRLEAMTQVAAEVVHDLKNILLIVSCSAEMIREQTEEGSAIRADADMIVHACERGTVLVTELLRVARRDQLFAVRRPS